MMVKQRYTVRFMTPAFLGDAEQNGEWRTPPFKALLRQWWRVAVAKDYGYDHERLREAEGKLFGNAWPNGNSQESRLRIRLGEWRQGKMQKWNEREEKLKHPEINFSVDANLYLGYGPLIYDKTTKKPALKANAAMQADDYAEIFLAYPKDLASLFSDIVQLIHWFGTLGGRSRNGWGSLDFSGDGVALKPLEENSPLLGAISRPLQDCLGLDWPHAIGHDNNRLLIWRTNQQRLWRDIMKQLAQVKIAFRTQPSLAFNRNKDIKKPIIDHRHFLSYPVTHHGVEGWCDKDKKTGKLITDKHGYLKQSTRLANQLRFKVAKTTEGYIGLAYHLPCGIPGELLDALSAADRSWIVGEQLGVWQSVHTVLDQHMQRI